MQDQIVDVIIPPQLVEELLKCNVGTVVNFELNNKNDKIFTNKIEYIEKLVNNVAR